MLKRLGGILVFALALCAGGVLIWSRQSISIDTNQVDPAVTLANRFQGSGLPVFEEHYFAYKERSLHYVTAGPEAGEVVLFLHGFPSFWYSSIRQMQTLYSDYRVVGVDGLGVGRSDAPRELDAYALEAMAAHLVALIDELGAERAHIVGHDWGAAFAFGFAQRFPERVHTVTGISAPPQSVILELLANVPLQRSVFAYVERLKAANVPMMIALNAEKRVWEGAYKPLVISGKLSAAEGALFREVTGQTKRLNAHINWYRANIPAPDAVSEADYWPRRNASIPAPALFIWGESDALITDEMLLAIESVGDDMRMLPISNAGHWPHIREPDLVTGAIEALLKIKVAAEAQ